HACRISFVAPNVLAVYCSVTFIPRSHTMFRFLCLTVALSAVLVSAAAPARAQDVMTKESVASLKASFVADLDTLHQKFLGLAQAFPQDKYTWRPMDGVRSVSEVLMLAAMEGYSFIPMGFGAKAADLGSREEAAKLRTLSDKTQVRHYHRQEPGSRVLDRNIHVRSARLSLGLRHRERIR